ncbi:MAG: hypothetical protein V4850_21110 [Myxococcota bacterium]
MLLALLAWSDLAYATNYNVRFCMNWTVDFGDVGGGDDFFTTNGARVARGTYWEVRNAADNSLLYSGYAVASGTNEGCTPTTLPLNSSVDYDVLLYSKAYVNGNTIVVYDDTSTPSMYANQMWSDWSPTASTTVTADTSTVGDWVNVTAAATTTIFRHNGGVTGKTFVVYDKGENGTLSGCQTHTTPNFGGSKLCGDEVFITEAHASRKYLISHEVAHLLARYKDEDLAPNIDYDATDPPECLYGGTGDHAMSSLEFQSAAAVEGWAHFIAAVTFNDTSESDCSFYYWKDVDWDADTLGDGSPKWVDCEYASHCDNVDESCGPIVTHDHMGYECGLTTANRAVEYDWLRFWWDTHTDAGETFLSCMDVWDRADPHDWLDVGTSPPADMPYARIRKGADDEDILAGWDDRADYEGVDR